MPADRAVSEYLVTHPGVDKVSFTGLHRGRPPGRLARDRAAEAGLARAGRQVRGDRARRRRPRGERVHDRLLRPDEQRPGLRRADPHPRAALALRRDHRGHRRVGEDDDRRRPDRPDDAARPAGRRAPARPGRGLHREGQGRGRPARARRHPAGRPRHRAGTSRRPSSPTSTTR